MSANIDPPTGVSPPPHPQTGPDTEALRAHAGFRAALRKFLYFSELEAESAGLTTQRFQALLAIWAHRDRYSCDISVGELSSQLLIRDHSGAELVARLAASGLVDRAGDRRDKRKTLILLTPEGERRLRTLAAAQIQALGASQAVWTELLSAFAAGRGG